MLLDNPGFIGTLIVFYSLFLFLSLYIRGIVFFEWVISFLHYILPFNLVLLMVIFGRPGFFPSFLLLSAVTIPLLIRFLNFTVLKPASGTGNKKLTILFFNKLYFNRNYLEISEKIKEIKPDIIGMVELQDGEMEKIPALSDYPHRFYKPSRPNAALGLLSKHPFSTRNLPDLPHVIVSTMKLENKEYQILVFHPSPPLYPRTLTARENDLKNLTNFLEKQDNPNTILMGDFNVTPWSSSYLRYLSTLKHLKNTAKGTSLHNTLIKGPLRVFIDFIFVPNNSFVESFKTHFMKGSDHKLISAVIKL